jgi:hypothetical protein
MKPKLPSSASDDSAAALRLKVYECDTLTVLRLDYEDVLGQFLANTERARDPWGPDAEDAAAPIVAIAAESPLALARARAHLLFFLAENKRRTKRESIRLAWLTLSRSDSTAQGQAATPWLRFADLRGRPNATDAFLLGNAACAELAQGLADPWFSGVLLTHPDGSLVGAWIAVLKPDAITAISARELHIELEERIFDYTELYERGGPLQQLLRGTRHVVELLTAVTAVTVMLRALGII